MKSNVAFRKFINDNKVGKGTALQVDVPWGEKRVRHLIVDVSNVQSTRGRYGQTEIVGVQRGSAQIHRFSFRSSEVIGMKVLPKK